MTDEAMTESGSISPEEMRQSVVDHLLGNLALLDLNTGFSPSVLAEISEAYKLEIERWINLKLDEDDTAHQLRLKYNAVRNEFNSMYGE